MKIRLIKQRDVRQCLTMPQAIDLMECAFKSLSLGEIEVPMRTNIANSAGTMLYKPVSTSSVFGLKAVSVFPGNAAKTLPVTTGLMLINDGQTGLPIGLMDAEYLTALRTGAGSGLATRLLANPEASTAALFGTGGQAACQLQALLAVLPLRTVHVFSRQQTRAESFCRDHAATAGDCSLTPGVSNRVLAECGVISTATTTTTPLFEDHDLSKGTHLNGIGSFTKEMAEVPPETVARAEVFVDQRAPALLEAGDLTQSIERGFLQADFSPAELGEVLLGRRPGRLSNEQITFFKSVGNAAQDVVCATAVMEHAKTYDLGQVIEL